MITVARTAPGLILLAGVGALRADVVTLNPVADAFVTSAHPDSNYGGSGSLGVAATGLPNGEFQVLFRFDCSSAAATFDASLGAGQWIVQSVSLQLNATPPVNPIFNAAAAGQFAISWLQNDGWDEGSGTPNMPGTTGVTFGTLPDFLSAADEELGVFDFDGATTGVTVRDLALPAPFVADVTAGNAVSLRVRPVGATVAYLFNSRSFQTVAARPVLAITAGSAATCYANCDHSTAAPVLNVADFTCFLQKFAAADSYANCDQSTAAPALNVADFTCFLQKFAAGCP